MSEAKKDESDLSALLCFDDAISMAKGSLDYMGGYHNEDELDYEILQAFLNCAEKRRYGKAT